MSLRMGWMAVALLAVLFFCADVQAAEVKIGVFDFQKVLSQSTYGQAAQKRLESRKKELEAQLKPEADALAALKKDIEQKGSVWSEEVKADKGREFQKKLQEFLTKRQPAEQQLQQLEGKEFEPIAKALPGIVDKIGKDGGYTMIIEQRAGVVYFNPAIDLSDTIAKRLDATLK